MHCLARSIRLLSKRDNGLYSYSKLYIAAWRNVVSERINEVFLVLCVRLTRIRRRFVFAFDLLDERAFGLNLYLESPQKQVCLLTSNYVLNTALVYGRAGKKDLHPAREAGHHHCRVGHFPRLAVTLVGITQCSADTRDPLRKLVYRPSQASAGGGGAAIDRQ